MEIDAYGMETGYAKKAWPLNVDRLNLQQLGCGAMRRDRRLRCSLASDVAEWLTDR
jgi:hypothetical protein